MKRWFVLCLLAACVDGPAEDTVEQGLTDPGILATVPGIAAPAGYGNYCSVTDPTNGGWALWAVTSGDSCAQLAPQVGSHAIVRRAGLWAINGNNNVMVRCDGGGFAVGRAYGSAAIDWIFKQASASQKNCFFIISPTKLFAFGMPFTPTTLTGTSVFDYRLQGGGWNIADFGRTGGDGNACDVDRTGYEAKSCFGGTPVQPNPSPHAVFEPAYDWSMAIDTPILAVADGVVRGSQQRVVEPMCEGKQSDPGSKQLELFLETQIGSGQYAEHFVAGYHHMNPHPNTLNPSILQHVVQWGGPMAPVGTIVKKGDVIGYIGSSGCSGGPHLDLSMFRLTNLTGARSYVFQALMTTYDVNGNATFGIAGVNGWQGIFDPFGWAAPQNVDPLAYKFLGLGTYYDAPTSVTDNGVFGIDLWDPLVFSNLPHNGGAAW